MSCAHMAWKTWTGKRTQGGPAQGAPWIAAEGTGGPGHSHLKTFTQHPTHSEQNPSNMAQNTELFPVGRNWEGTGGQWSQESS